MGLIHENSVSLMLGVFERLGPEGGFTDEEAAFASHCEWQIVDLGSRLLRVETAALALTVAVLYR